MTGFRALFAAAVIGVASLASAETKTIDRTLPLTAAGVVALNAHNGTVQIRTWDRAEVSVHVQINSWSGSTYRFRNSTVDVDGSPDRVSIRWHTPEDSGWRWWSFVDDAGWLDVHYTITAPKTAKWEIRTHNAEADIRDVSGAIRLDTHNGAVAIANLNGPLDLSMHNGRARVDFASFTGDSRISTHNGTAEITLPPGAGLNLRSTVFHGHLESDFPLTIRALNYGWHGPREASASINGGGPALTLTSHNGWFGLRSKP
jgi:hypothetical protein